MAAHRVRSAVLIVALAAFALLNPSFSQAQKPLPPSPSQLKQAFYQQIDLPAMRSGYGPSAVRDAIWGIKQSQVADGLPGSYAVFESARDGNWEIYRAEDGDGGLTRLTFNTASDITPKIRLNGSKIVFASRRDGNYEIYSMDPNGANPTRLTFDSANDIQPTWSADGSQIYFSSNRGGNYNIWVMNADGSGQVAVTNTASQEYYPTASPLGDKIAWVRADASNIGTIVVTTLDGGWSTTTSSCRYLAHPMWSPDGRYMAYDCDSDGDYWNEINVVGVQDDTYGSTVAYDAGQELVDAQMDGWSANGTDVLFTQIRYAVNGNTLVATQLVPGQVSFHGGTAVAMPFAVGADAFVDWKYVDNQPPASSFTSLPQYAEWNSSFKVMWGATDSGPAGANLYSVQFRQDDGDWLSSVTDRKTQSVTQYTSSSIGQRFVFRVRARDNAGNLEPWPTTPGPSYKEVLLYDGSISGTLTDNRNVPLVNVSLTLGGNTPANVPTRFDGTFFGPFTRISSGSPHTITVAKAGFAAIPDVVVSGMQLTRLSYRPYLPAPDDVIVNGHFSLQASGWVTGGAAQVEGGIMMTSLTKPSAILAYPSSVISQVVTLAPTMTHPTLAFVRQNAWFGQPNAPRPTFEVKVDDGTSVTTLLTETPPISELTFGPPELLWADMQRWVGKTVTVTFVCNETGNPQYAGNVTIDDVSISSWLTPVPTHVTPQASTLASGSVITITGQNFIAPAQVHIGDVALADVQWVDANTVIATLPSSITPGRYDVTVTNASGQSNVLLGALTVGRETFVPVVVR